MKNMFSGSEFKSLLSAEWNKPKSANLKRDAEGNIIDKREPRDYKEIKRLQKLIAEEKK